jgi:hypothetical protein
MRNRPALAKSAGIVVKLEIGVSSTTRYPLRASSARVADLPVPDIPVTSTTITAPP